MTPLGNKLDENDYSAGNYFVGRDTSLRFDDTSTGDSVDKLCWKI